MKKYNVVIVGGGSHRNPDLMAMLASKKDVFPLKRVVLYDNEAERQEIMGQYGEILMREYYPELEEFIYTTDPDVAFKDVIDAEAYKRIAKVMKRALVFLKIG